VRVIATEDAVKTGLPEWELAMPLGEKEDESVLAFLARAEAAGARYVSDVNVVFAAEKDGQLLECRTHITPVETLQQGVWDNTTRRLARTGGVRETVGYTNECKASAGKRVECVQVPVVRETPTRFAALRATDVPVNSSPIGYRKLWRLKKSAPECTPREAEARELLVAAERIEGHAYGCGEAVAGSACEDKVL
jgi:hypothetical protein